MHLTIYWNWCIWIFSIVQIPVNLDSRPNKFPGEKFSWQEFSSGKLNWREIFNQQSSNNIVPYDFVEVTFYIFNKRKPGKSEWCTWILNWKNKTGQYQDSFLKSDIRIQSNKPELFNWNILHDNASCQSENLNEFIILSIWKKLEAFGNQKLHPAKINVCLYYMKSLSILLMKSNPKKYSIIWSIFLLEQ